MGAQRETPARQSLRNEIRREGGVTFSTKKKKRVEKKKRKEVVSVELQAGTSH